MAHKSGAAVAEVRAMRMSRRGLLAWTRQLIIFERLTFISPSEWVRLFADCQDYLDDNFQF